MAASVIVYREVRYTWCAGSRTENKVIITHANQTIHLRHHKHKRCIFRYL